MQSMKADQERVSKLLTDTVTLLCKNGLIYKDEIKIQGLLGITLDRNDVFIVHINETITSKDGSSDSAGKKGGPTAGVPVVDLTRIADTPMIPAQQMRGMGGMVPGMPPSLGGGGGMGSRKQRPQMPQMMSRGQYMPVPRFRMGMPPHSPASLQAAMASQMNNHMMYSRQPGAHQGMSQVRHRMQQAPPHLVTPRRQQMQQQQQQPPATVSIDDDEDVVIIGTGHEEPSPNWNSPVRRNQQGRSGSSSQQMGNSSHVKSTASISMSSAVAPITPATVTAGTSSLVEVDQTPITVTLGEHILEEANDLEITLNEAEKDGDGQPKLIQILGEAGQCGTSDDTVTAAAMLIEPNDNVSDGDGDHVRADPEADAADEPCDATHKNDEVLNQEVLKVKVDTDADPGVALDDRLSSGETERLNSTDGNVGKISGDSSSSSKSMLSEQGAKSVGESGDHHEEDLPVVYTDIAEPLLFGGSQVTDMDIQTLGFDILTEDDHDVAHSSSQLSAWICKSPLCSVSFADAKDLATHYVHQHTDVLNLMSTSCNLPLATTDSSMSEGSERGSSDGSVRRKLVRVMHCPFTGCQNKFSSWPGLNLHHKKVHGAPLSLKERKEIVALYGKPFKCTADAAVCQKTYMTKRELYRHVTKAHEAAHDGSDSSSLSIPANTNSVTGASAGGEAMETEAAVAKNFLCLYNDCEVLSSSREALVEHLQACHGSVSGPDSLSSPAAVKEETTDDVQ